jgi:endoglucanase
VSVKDFLQKLSQAHGVSGYEHAIRDLVIEEFRPLVDELSVDPLGNIIAIKRGTRNAKDKTPVRKVLIEGHMDEIGFLVTNIDHGFIRFTQVGGFDVRVLLSQQVIVHGKKQLPGIIGSRPPHVLSADERDHVIPMSELFVDVGLPEDKVNELVQVGDMITIARDVIALKNNLIAGKAFDDRAAVATVAEALHQLQSMKHSFDVYAIANVQEEVGLRGAMTSTFTVNPDVAIAIDVGHADQPNVPEVNRVPLNDGMGIAMGPNIHPVVHQKMVRIAESYEIPYKVTAYAGATGTNAWAIQVVREGIPTGLIDIPLRYMHTSVETLSVNDLERIGRLLALFCASLDENFIDEMSGKTEEPIKTKNVKRKTTRKRK